MPSNILSADTGFPTFTDGQSTETKINIIQNYLYMLLEQLRYSMSNLGASNFNDAELQEISKTIREPILVQLQDIDGNLSELQVTAKGLVSTVQDMQGNLSAIEQYAKGIRLSVTNGETSSTITLTANGTEISSANIVFNGVVSFINGCANGSTVINGGCIQTGKVAAKYLNLSGAIAWSDLTSSAQKTISGFADDMAQAIADGEYEGGTFISGNGIYSPEVYSNDFQIHAKNGGSDGAITLLGRWGRDDLRLLRISYYAGDAPVVEFESPARAVSYWIFQETYVSSRVTFNNDVTFKGSVSGITTSSVQLEQPSPIAQDDTSAEGPSFDGQVQADSQQTLTLYDAGGCLGVQLASGTRWILNEEGWKKQ